MRNIYIIFLLNFIFTKSTFSQTEIADTSKLDEIVISANRTSQKRSEVAQQISIISSDYISSQSPLNTADLLQSTGNVFVQKSQQGGGSPVLRGFEASRILIVIDGVRMNNLIYRAGHLQNVITLDPNVMERVEILNGPSSTVYGSDALGGVLHFRTKNPVFSYDGSSDLSGSFSAGYHTANNGTNFNFNVNAGWKNFASFSSVTVTKFGDLRMGSAKNPYNKDGYYGERPYYVDRINNQDVLVQNENKFVQKYSGYDQIDILQKFLYKPSERSEHSLNIQYSTSSNIPRYDRLTDVKGTGLNSSEWYYGPQDRFFAAYNFTHKLSGFFEKLDVTGSMQSLQESRHNRGFESVKLNHRIEDVTIGGLQISALHKSIKNEFQTGVDLYWNGLKSTATQENISTKISTSLDTRYPDGKNTLINGAAYATHSFRFNDHLILNDGIRLGFNKLSSTFNNKTFFPFPFDDVTQNNFVYSGSIALIYNKNGFKGSYMTSLGFRAPNVDDLSKVFESAPGAIIIPNPNIKPETTLNNEINLGYFNKSWSFENVVFYSSLSDFISLAPGTYEGKSTILYNGTQSQVFTSVNKAKGYIYGLNSSISKKLNSHWLAYATVNYTYGRSKNEGNESPLDHIAPLLTKLGIESKFDLFEGAFYVIANGKKKISDYSPSGEDNAQYAPASGMPAWMTLNARGGYKVNKYFKLQAGVENILDIQYRYFSSGINAPGRNIWMSLKVNF